MLSTLDDYLDNFILFQSIYNFYLSYLGNNFLSISHVSGAKLNGKLNLLPLADYEVKFTNEYNITL